MFQKMPDASYPKKLVVGILAANSFCTPTWSQSTNPSDNRDSSSVVDNSAKAINGTPATQATESTLELPPIPEEVRAKAIITMRDGTQVEFGELPVSTKNYPPELWLAVNTWAKGKFFSEFFALSETYRPKPNPDFNYIWFHLPGMGRKDEGVLLHRYGLIGEDGTKVTVSTRLFDGKGFYGRIEAGEFGPSAQAHGIFEYVGRYSASKSMFIQVWNGQYDAIIKNRLKICDEGIAQLETRETKRRASGDMAGAQRDRAEIERSKIARAELPSKSAKTIPLRQIFETHAVEEIDSEALEMIRDRNEEQKK